METKLARECGADEAFSYHGSQMIQFGSIVLLADPKQKIYWNVSDQYGQGLLPQTGQEIKLKNFLDKVGWILFPGQ